VGRNYHAKVLMSKNQYHSIQSQKENKKRIDPFVIGVAITILVVFIGIVMLGSSAGTSPEVITDAKVAITPLKETSFDWGTISINGGVVSKTFDIENASDAPLKLYEVLTSCMCTTAQLTTDTQTSKKFGMHEKSSSVFEVNPHETATLTVEFDPAFHGPSGVGPISRTVTMNTNDPQNPTLSFSLSAVVSK